MRIHRVVHDRIDHIRKVDGRQRGGHAAAGRLQPHGRDPDALPEREREAEHHLRGAGDALAQGVDGHGGCEERSGQAASRRQPRKGQDPGRGLGKGECVGGGGTDGAAGDGTVPTAGYLAVEGCVEGVVPGAGCAAEEEAAHGVAGAQGDEGRHRRPRLGKNGGEEGSEEVREVERVVAGWLVQAHQFCEGDEAPW